jgi:hypothetical protein
MIIFLTAEAGRLRFAQGSSSELFSLRSLRLCARLFRAKTQRTQREGKNADNKKKTRLRQEAGFPRV